MCNSARDILLCMLSDTIHACVTKLRQIGLRMQISGNLSKSKEIWELKKEFRFQAVEALNDTPLWKCKAE